MAGLGLVVMFIGYTVIFWAVQAIQRKDQAPFTHYIFPWNA